MDGRLQIQIKERDANVSTIMEVPIHLIAGLLAFQEDLSVNINRKQGKSFSIPFVKISEILADLGTFTSPLTIFSVSDDEDSIDFVVDTSVDSRFNLGNQPKRLVVKIRENDGDNVQFSVPIIVFDLLAKGFCFISEGRGQVEMGKFVSACARAARKLGTGCVLNINESDGDSLEFILE